MALDQATTALLEEMAGSGLKPLQELTPAEARGRMAAQGTGCVVILVDYRLAPEYRFPTAVDDSWAALRWADEHRAELAGAGLADPGLAGARPPLIVAGDSAGGNLSAVMALRARAAGG